MSNANIKLIQDIYAAFGRGDVAGIVSRLDPNVDWCSVGRQSDHPTFGQRNGAAAVTEFFGTVAACEDVTEFSPQEFHAAEDKVFVLGHYSMKIRKTGKTVAADWIHIFTVKDGKVVKWREHTDTAQFAEANRA
jgi:ketosteroid isomerase-like protein